MSVFIAIQIIAGFVLIASFGLVWRESRRLDDEIRQLDSVITRLERKSRA